MKAAQRRKDAPIPEHTHDALGRRCLDDLGRDLGYALRELRRGPGFAAAVVLILALGIGVNTAMFSIAYGVLLRPLPYPDPGAIVRIGESVGARGISDMRLSNRSMPLLEEFSGSFEQLAAYEETSAEWDGLGGVNLRGARVSPSLFPLLRATPHLGRLLLQEEARTGAEHVALLSYDAWARRFASNPTIIGATISLDGNPYLVVGVLAEGFYFPTSETEFWIPYIIPPVTRTATEDATGHRSSLVREVTFNALGRLRPGISSGQAATEARSILQDRSNVLLALSGETEQHDVRVVPLLEEMVGGYRSALVMLTTVALLVLLVACLSVAGLLLARAVARRRTLAISAALGASPSRLVRQLLTESTVLGLGGGLFGLAAANVSVRAVPALLPVDVVRLDEVRIDGVVLAFTVGLSLLVGCLCGAGPAFQRSLVHPVRTLNDGGAEPAGCFGRLRAHRVLALLSTVQVALALVLLIGAGLLSRSLLQLVTFDRGYDPANVVTASVLNVASLAANDGTWEAFRERQAFHQRFQLRLFDELTTRLESMSDVDAFGVSWNLPLLRNAASELPVSVPGAAVPSAPGATIQAEIQIVTPGYFETLRFRLREGRTFTRLDGSYSPRVLVLNETLARALFESGPVVGRRVMVVDEPWEVIGVVGDVLYGTFDVTAQSHPEGFIPQAQVDGQVHFGISGLAIVSIRTSESSPAMMPFLREAVAATHSEARMNQMMTMEERLSRAVAEPRLYAFFVSSLAGLTVVLAAFAVYGLLSYMVAQRRSEIAVRIMLGAGPRQILGLVLRQGAALVSVGILLGLGAALASGRMLDNFLYGVADDDVLTFVMAALLLVAVALFACWLPARRATRVSPMNMLRSG